MWIKIVDFGLVVLIWMTQLIVYPSFTYFSESDLSIWHSKYTSAISIIVMPLMIAQVILYAQAILIEFSWIKLIAVFLIVLVWANTFLFAVPLHGKITQGKEIASAAEKLVSVNWYRTIFWSIVFLLNWFPSKTA